MSELLRSGGEWRIPVANVFKVVAVDADGKVLETVCETCVWLDEVTLEQGQRAAANARAIATLPLLAESAREASDLLEHVEGGVTVAIADVVRVRAAIAEQLRIINRLKEGS